MSENTVTLSPVEEIVIGKLSEMIHAANERTARLNAGQDENSTVAVLRDSSDDAKVVKFREKVEELDAKRLALVEAVDAHIREHLMPAPLAVEDREKVTAELAKIRAEIREMEKAGKTLLNGADISGHLPNLIGRRAAGKSGGTTGTRRPALESVFVDGELASKEITNAKGEVRIASTFSLACAAIGRPADVKAMQTAYLDAAEVTEFADAPTEVEFAFPDKDGKPRIIRAIKK